MKLLLASGSPRRSQLLRALDIPFEVRVPRVEEVYPDGLPLAEVAPYLAKLKATAAAGWLDPETLILTADSVVILGDRLFGKPRDLAEAREMLWALSGKTHRVTTGICLLSTRGEVVRAVSTEVSFREASDAEIDYYVKHYPPLDRAGAYGIQDWWGWAKVNRIEGSYSNVMGLPTVEVIELLGDRISLVLPPGA